MSDGHGHDGTPPAPPIVPDPVVHVVEDAQVVQSDQPGAIRMTASDGVSYTIVQPPPRIAEKPPRIDPTELSE